MEKSSKVLPQNFGNLLNKESYVKKYLSTDMVASVKKYAKLSYICLGNHLTSVIMYVDILSGHAKRNKYQKF